MVGLFPTLEPGNIITLKIRFVIKILGRSIHEKYICREQPNSRKRKRIKKWAGYEKNAKPHDNVDSVGSTLG